LAYLARKGAEQPAAVVADHWTLLASAALVCPQVGAMPWSGAQALPVAEQQRLQAHADRIVRRILADQQQVLPFDGSFDAERHVTRAATRLEALLAWTSLAPAIARTAPVDAAQRRCAIEAGLDWLLQAVQEDGALPRQVVAHPGTGHPRAGEQRIDTFQHAATALLLARAAMAADPASAA